LRHRGRIVAPRPSFPSNNNRSVIGTRIIQVTYAKPDTLTSPYDPEAVLSPPKFNYSKLPTLEPKPNNATAISLNERAGAFATPFTILPPFHNKIPIMEPEHKLKESKESISPSC